jgi:hypothetical protein
MIGQAKCQRSSASFTTHLHRTSNWALLERADADNRREIMQSETKLL